MTIMCTKLHFFNLNPLNQFHLSFGSILGCNLTAYKIDMYVVCRKQLILVSHSSGVDQIVTFYAIFCYNYPIFTEEMQKTPWMHWMEKILRAKSWGYKWINMTEIQFEKLEEAVDRGQDQEVETGDDLGGIF